MARCDQFRQGTRNGIKACVEWLHAEAETMTDPHARQLLNGAAWRLGSDMKARATEPNPPKDLP